MIISTILGTRKISSIQFTVEKSSLDNEEEILIDANEMSKGYDYFRVGMIEISPDNKTMAYSIDTVSRRIYTIHFMDLET